MRAPLRTPAHACPRLSSDAGGDASGDPSHRVAAVGLNHPVDISAKTDYAVRALLTIAAVEGASPVSADTLAQEQQLPRKFLESILGDLRRGGLVVSQRGAAGGYTLARPADQIAVAEVFRVVAGPLAEVRGLRPHETSYDGAAQHLPTLWVAVRASLREVLDETSLADLLTGQLPDHVRELADRPGAWQSR